MKGVIVENSLFFCRIYARTVSVIPGVLLIPLLILSVTACVNVRPEVSGGAGRPATVSPLPSPPQKGASEMYPTSTEVIEGSSARPTSMHAARPRPVRQSTRPAPAASPSPENPVLAPIVAAPATPLVKGSAAYFIPEKMMEKKPSRVDLWIDPTSSMEQLKRDFAARFNISPDNIQVSTVQDDGEKYDTAVAGKLISMKIPIGTTMIAELRGGEGFDIEPKGPVSHKVEGADRVKWNWGVQPKQASTTKIPLYLEISISSGGGKPWNNIYDAAVLVEATPQTWHEKLYEIAQKLNAWLALLGIGGIGGLYAFLSRKKAT